MPPIPAQSAALRIAPGATQPVPRFFEDPVLNQAVKDQIVALLRHFPPAHVAEMVETNFHVTVDRAQMLAVWNERHAPKAETAVVPDERSPDKESLHPADELRECLLTPPEAEPEPAPSVAIAIATAVPPTRTGPGPEKASTPIPAGAEKEPIAPRKAPPVTTHLPKTQAPTQPRLKWKSVPIRKLSGDIQDYIIECMARHDSPRTIAKTLEESFGVWVDPEQIIVCWRDRDATPTQTGRRQNKDPHAGLSDEIKAFIVQRLACYETPSRIAAAVRNIFGVNVDRRQVFAYKPTGSRPPAQRWIDLHAATRARYLGDTAEIAVAQKVVRLRMLDRFAQTAEENNRDECAAKFLAQAARECGGFYDKRPLPATEVAPMASR